MSDAALRFQILTEARAMLFRHWEERLFVEKATAEFEKRAPKMINPPSLRKIMKTAEDLNSFVENKELPGKKASAEEEAV